MGFTLIIFRVYSARTCGSSSNVDGGVDGEGCLSSAKEMTLQALFWICGVENSSGGCKDLLSGIDRLT